MGSSFPEYGSITFASFIFGKGQGLAKLTWELQGERSPGLCLPLAAGCWALPQAWVGSSS